MRCRVNVFVTQTIVQEIWFPSRSLAMGGRSDSDIPAFSGTPQYFKFVNFCWKCAACNQILSMKLEITKNGTLLKWLRGMKMSAQFLRVGVYRPIVDIAYWCLCCKWYHSVAWKPRSAPLQPVLAWIYTVTCWLYTPLKWRFLIRMIGFIST
jgi:hypothetical protein